MGRAASTLSFVLDEEISVQNTQRDKPFYRPELDAVRFFAFFGIFCAHCYGPSNPAWNVFKDAMRFSVALFFLLSSYLITELLRKERSATGSLHLRNFYIRRVLRIWPLYFLIILIAIVIGHFYTPWVVTRTWVVSALFLWSNLFIIIFGWPGSPLLRALWSISVEEQFYILVPGLAKLGGSKAIRWFSILVILAAYAYTWKFGLIKGRYLALNSLVMFQFFAAGTLLATFLKGTVPSFSLRLRLCLLGSGIGLWLLGNHSGIGIRFTARATHWTPVYGWASVLVGTMLIFLAFLGASPRIRFSKIILYLGTISYGLYVYHEGVLILVHSTLARFWDLKGMPEVASVISLCLTIAISAVSYEWIEKPFIRLKSRFELVKCRGSFQSPVTPRNFRTSSLEQPPNPVGDKGLI